MIPRSLFWAALVLALAAPHASAQCNDEVGLSLMPLGPGCQGAATPVLSIDHVGVMLEFSITSQHPNSPGAFFVSLSLPGDPVVFADCLIYVNSNLLITANEFQTNANGAHAFASVVPALEQLVGLTFVMQSALAFQQAPIYGFSASNAFLATVTCAEGTGGPTEGCGPGFWSQTANIGNWPAQYSPTTLFSSVFENAFPGLTLDQVLEQTGTGLNAAGRHAVAALLNAATIPGFPLTTVQVISMFNAVYPGGDYTGLATTFEALNNGNCPFSGPSPTQSCSPSFWSQAVNSANWPSQYTPNTQFSSVFEDAFPGLSLLQVLQQSGTGLNALGRHAVAALLNAATIQSYPLSVAQVISMFNAVFPGGDYTALATTLEALNNGNCPFGAPSPSEGCSVAFWSDDENNENWPAQYTPTTLFAAVFENAFPGLTLDQVLDQSGTGLNALGRQAVAALLNAATIPGFPLSTAQVISMFNAAFPGGDYAALTATLLELNNGDCPFGGPSPSQEGCSHGFWKNHTEAWPSQYSPNAAFSSVFENAFQGMTLLEVLQQGGGGLNALGRQLVAALLNAATIEDFPLTTAQIISMFNEVFPGGDYEALKDALEELNTGDCPFDDPSSSEAGCSVAFWGDDENNGDWPAQYTPATLFSSVFEDAFPGLTLGQVLDQSGTGLNALGRQVVAALLNAATIQGFPLTTAQVIAMFNVEFPGGNYAELTAMLLELNSGDCPFDDPSPSESCSHGFWKNHSEAWPSQYSPTAQFSSVFENAFPGVSFQQVLEQGGGGLNALGRELVAALLNAATIQGFPLTTAQIISMFNEAFPGGDYDELHNTLEELNSGDCPF